jgi:peptidoglycan/LPS O-acetylase OafA/YrhL
MDTLLPVAPQPAAVAPAPDPHPGEPRIPVPGKRRPAPVDALTSLRGLAALWVLGHHFRGDFFTLFGGLRPLDPLLALGHIAVPYFFILSGFVLAYNYAPDFRRLTFSRYTAFIGRRWVRIYPVHLFTLLCVLAMVLACSRLGITINRADKFMAPDFLLNLFLVQAWVPDYQLNWNGASWSISSEWFAYLLFPVVCLGLNRLRSAREAAVLAVLGWAACVAFYVFGGHMPFWEVLAVVPTFLTGCTVWAWVQRRSSRPAVPRRLPDLIVLATLVTPLLLASIPGLDERARNKIGLGLMVTYFASTILCFGSLGNSCSRVWLSKPLLFLGEVSYSLYMTHGLVLMLLQKLLPSARYVGAGLGVRLAVVVAYAAMFAAATLVTYYLVENPARKHLWKLLAGRRRREKP